MTSETSEAVYDVVRTLPPGRVATYAQVADMVETVPVGPRQVGQIMSWCPEGAPWHRVVGAGGRLPIGKRDPRLAATQRALLEAEGVAFTPGGCVDMGRHQLRADPPDGDGPGGRR